MLDAYEKDNKLKFANHFLDPNCYVEVIMDAGDKRIGILTEEQICTREELFFNYYYEIDRNPTWIRILEASSSKQDCAGHSSSHAKKHT